MAPIRITFVEYMYLRVLHLVLEFVSPPQKLCDYVSDLLLEESNVQPVSTPITVCGDIHGQFYDLQKLFQTGGQVPDTSYVFMVV